MKHPTHPHTNRDSIVSTTSTFPSQGTLDAWIPPANNRTKQNRLTLKDVSQWRGLVKKQYLHRVPDVINAVNRTLREQPDTYTYLYDVSRHVCSQEMVDEDDVLSVIGWMYTHGLLQADQTGQLTPVGGEKG